MEDLPLPGQCRYRSASAAARTSRFRTSRWCLRISRPAHHRQQIISDRSRSTGSFGFPWNLNGVTKTGTEVDVRAGAVIRALWQRSVRASNDDWFYDHRSARVKGNGGYPPFAPQGL